MAEENAINMFCQLNKKSNFSIFTFKAVFFLHHHLCWSHILYFHKMHRTIRKCEYFRCFCCYIVFHSFRIEAPDVRSAVFSSFLLPSDTTLLSLIFCTSIVNVLKYIYLADCRAVDAIIFTLQVNILGVVLLVVFIICLQHVAYAYECIYKVDIHLCKYRYILCLY